jgi:hypothetical protein
MSALSPVLPAFAGPADTARAPTSAGEKWLHWLRVELTRRGPTPESRLLLVWDVLEEWLGSEAFQSTLIAGASELPCLGHPTRAAVRANRDLLRCMLEQLAIEAGASAPHALAYQLLMLFEGTVAGALIDRRPPVTGVARHLASLALEAQS